MKLNPFVTVNFFGDGCKELWGRAVANRSISSILNYSLNVVNQFMDANKNLFSNHDQLLEFFARNGSVLALSSGLAQTRKELKKMEQCKLSDIVSDMEDA
eukprot:CCRYP_005108-RA/>CCRYP_005108-RA protein AED:0.23 eAED:0.23 QI:0/-1/0/1/-1/1/1/0/99